VVVLEWGVEGWVEEKRRDWRHTHLQDLTVLADTLFGTGDEQGVGAEEVEDGEDAGGGLFWWVGSNGHMYISVWWRGSK
jgi:hypothetical protein